jgi:catechol 2,3-dioxygenase-like lactoylglutathione lyase family enzyme
VTGVKKIDHVAIAVRSIDESRRTFEGIYGAQYLGQKENTEQQYVVV